MKQNTITIIFIIIIIFVVTMIILMRLFGKRGGLTAGDLDRKQWVDLVGGGAFLITILQGEIRPNFWLKVLSAPLSLNWLFSQKRPNVDQKRTKVSKIDKIRTKWHLTHCGNPPILSSKRLWQEMYWNIHPSLLCNIDRVKFNTSLSGRK